MCACCQVVHNITVSAGNGSPNKGPTDFHDTLGVCVGVFTLLPPALQEGAISLFARTFTKNNIFDSKRFVL